MSQFLPPEPPGQSLHDFLVMMTGTDDHTAIVAGKIARSGLSSVSILNRDNRNSLRTIFDAIDERADLWEPLGTFIGAGMLSRYTQALESGQMTPQLAVEVLEVLQIIHKLTGLMLEVEDLGDPNSKATQAVRLLAGGLRTMLDPPPSAPTD